MEDRHIPSRQPKEQMPPQPPPECEPAQAAPATPPAAKKPRRKASTLTLEEQEEQARQKVAQASKELARIRLEKEKRTRHLKLSLAEIVIATAKRRGSRYLDEILNAASTAGVPITATPDEIATIYRLATPDAKKAAPEGTA